MPRLTKSELARHRAWLSDWHTPADMAAYVSVINNVMGSADFFGQGGVEFLRDAWLAAEFGRHRQSSSVRLVSESEQWPDFEARDGGGTERVECAEADIPGRRRGDEYREARKRNAGDGPIVEDDPIEDWIARADQAPAALSAVIATKIGKHYAGRASLLVYLNISEFGVRQAEIEAAMAPAIAPALPYFLRVWILWKDRLHGPWTTEAEWPEQTKCPDLTDRRTKEEPPGATVEAEQEVMPLGPRPRATVLSVASGCCDPTIPA